MFYKSNGRRLQRSSQDLAVTAWKRVSEVFASIWISYIVHPLTTLWSNIVSWWNTATTNTVTFTKSLWTQVTTVFGSAWTTYISKPLGTLWTNISTWFTTLATNFGTWASNALAMFTKSIVNGTKGVLDAITGLGANIAKILGFHSPPVTGPLSSSDQWMPNMVNMMANGITANSPKVTNSVGNMASGINNQFTNMNNQVNTSMNGMNNTVNSGFQKMSSNVQANTSSINSSMNGLQSNINSKSSAINSAIAGMSAGAISNLNNLNGQVQTVATAIPQSMSGVSSSVQQVTPVVASATGQWGQNIVDAGQIVASNSTKAISSVSNAATAIPKYAEAFQKGTSSMSAAAAEGASKVTQTNEKIITDTSKASKSLGQQLSDMLKQAESIAYQIAMAMHNPLGHSVPKIGPMKDDDKWGLHFMENLVGGMHKGMPHLIATVNTVASTLTGGIKIPLLTTTPGLAASNIAEGILTKIAVPPHRDRDRDWREDMTHITLQLDSKVIAETTFPRIAKEIHIQGGVRKL